MIEVEFREKANWLQRKCVLLCIEAFGIIGNTTFFRCLTCHKIVTADRLLKDGRCWCGGRRYKETNMTLLEEIKFVGRALLWKIRRGL